MSSTAYKIVLEAYSKIPSVASVLNTNESPAEYLSRVQTQYANNRTPTDEEIATFNRIREGIDAQFGDLCDVTMMQECHALSTQVPEENTLKQTIANHEKTLGLLINGIFVEWEYFLNDEENGSDVDEPEPPQAIEFFDNMEEEANKAHVAQRDFDMWLANNEKNIIEYSCSLGGPRIKGNEEAGDKKKSLTMSVGQFLPISASMHPSTGKTATFYISSGGGSEEDVLKCTRTKDPLSFTVQEPGMCGGDGRTVTWYLEALAPGKASVTLDCGWRGESVSSDTLNINIVSPSS